MVWFSVVLRRSLEMKLGYGLKSRSHRVVQDSSVVVVTEADIDGSKESSSSSSFWADMPQELLREVLVRLEASESGWPSRRSVVTCGGVCRTWREIMKELVRTPEVSGKFTFPISVKQVWFLMTLRISTCSGVIVLIFLVFDFWLIPLVRGYSIV